MGANLGKVEKKVLGAMLMLSNGDMLVHASKKDIAHQMGYKAVGGAITFAIDTLEFKNYICKEDEGYKVLL